MDRIDSSSIASLHAAFIAARGEFEDAVRLAEGRWEEPILEPEGGEGEPWPPHMAAGHALIGERWRFRHIDAVLAQPADEEPLSGETFGTTAAGEEELATRSEQYEALSSPAATLEVAAREWATIDAAFEGFSDQDLSRPTALSSDQLGYLKSMGQAPSNDLRGCLLLAVVHLSDHAQQIRAGLRS